MTSKSMWDSIKNLKEATLHINPIPIHDEVETRKERTRTFSGLEIIEVDGVAFQTEDSENWVFCTGELSNDFTGIMFGSVPYHIDDPMYFVKHKILVFNAQDHLTFK